MMPGFQKEEKLMKDLGNWLIVAMLGAIAILVLLVCFG